ncbi:TetR/AcrR family transcriptional regulator [Vallitalea okinawensis]|uniref:TetR/AcrR family transcriptional regulator n=1 Tax=Vallitalea okinawensis TaxID=2078660 RepID=UPI000CFAEB8C|nr:TetR/AcrR family transcriptional regulator [Vallitalea okinawensis]
MWISKDKNARKKEFLKTAIAMYKEHGYEATSINKILAEMNITKGSFYYHFDSKEDLLSQVVDFFLRDISSIANNIGESRSGAAEKLEMLMKEIILYREENTGLYKDFYEINSKMGNELIQIKYQEKIKDLFYEIIQQIIRQGKDEGVFNPIDFEETPELFLVIANHYKVKIANCYYTEHNKRENELQRLGVAFQQTIERLLGAKQGTLDFYSR